MIIGQVIYGWQKDKLDIKFLILGKAYRK